MGETINIRITVGVRMGGKGEGKREKGSDIVACPTILPLKAFSGRDQLQSWRSSSLVEGRYYMKQVELNGMGLIVVTAFDNSQIPLYSQGFMVSNTGNVGC